MKVAKENNKPYFIITIDTEADNLWSRPRNITTENAKYLERFQYLCEKYKFYPTYLANYEMAISKHFQDFGKYLIKNKRGEIGMHLHAWNTPPIFNLTENDYYYQPYLTEYPKNIIIEKIKYLTNLLEDIFNIKMVSHRGGRWDFNEYYAKLLIENGYCVDCSVTPHIDWKKSIGDPSKSGGPNYEKFVNKSYYIDINNIKVKGNSLLLEVPVTIIKYENPFYEKMKKIFKNVNILCKIINKIYSPICWLRPNGNNLKNMLNIVKYALNKNWDYIQFMLHSSELMPGGSPKFNSKKDIDKLYRDIDELFYNISKHFNGITLKEYYIKYTKEFNKNTE